MSARSTSSESSFSARLMCVTYNIHSGIGTDNRYDLDRIRRVLADPPPHVVALQELESCMSRPPHEDQASVLAAALDLRASFCAVRPSGEGSFGLGVLSRFPVLYQQHYDLSYHASREPRYCQRVDLEVGPGAVLHVFNCHLGLAARERVFQRNRMLSDAILLSEDLHHPVLLMGDFNDSPISVVHRSLRKHFIDSFAAVGKSGRPTFKFGLIPLRLDHIYCSRNIRVLDAEVRDEPLTRVASDHRPVMASLELTWPGSVEQGPTRRA